MIQVIASSLALHLRVRGMKSAILQMLKHIRLIQRQLPKQGRCILDGLVKLVLQSKMFPIEIVDII